MLPVALVLLLSASLTTANKTTWNPDAGYGLSGSDLLAPTFTCGQYGHCNEYNGQCDCPAGWGGIDCLIPQCDSLADGSQRRLREDGKSCECKEGWGGINCNVCLNDDACRNFPLSLEIKQLLKEMKGESDDDDQDDGPIADMTCYKGGQTVFNNHQMCNVTNRKIIDMLPDRPPQVTFSCDKSDKTCAFQFWTAEVESFYCALDQCESKLEVGYDFNVTRYDCEKVKCSCVPGRFICGEAGSVDIGEFLTQSIRGPATFSCKSGAGCRFEEPAMNELIESIFGDGYITLTCEGGECLHYTQVPGYVRPPKPDNTLWVALSSAGAVTFVLLSSAVIWFAGRSRPDEGPIKLPEEEAARLMTDHVPASLYFRDITYSLNDDRILLSNISGCVKPGQVMAIMGASGAGKSTLLDILARKRKKGNLISGTVLVNGREVANTEFKNVMGFVDQEDTLMGTLTVYETVLYSALLRLPREMSYEAKKFRTLETLNELGILHIKDMPIGVSGHRSISGGEKRRVSIACELVTSPSILFLDEPTSGLDAFNAYNVVESLVSLSRNYNRTVIFTIHQPRSNIVALFDQLLVLAAGKVVYSGEFQKCQEYFDEIGQPCPPGFNIADYLIDLTVKATIASKGTSSPATNASASASSSTNASATNLLPDEERGLPLAPRSVPISVRSVLSAPLDSDSNTATTDGRPAATSINSGSSRFTYFKQKTSNLLGSITNALNDRQAAPTLDTLVEAYEKSDIAKDISKEMKALQREVERGANGNGGQGGAPLVSNEPPDAVLETSLLRGRNRATWATQFRILSGRAFKNLYRDPALLAAHYLSAIGLAVICGLFFHNVTNDIAGFQNRLGIFFFTLALFGFSCLSSLGLFANERILFMRERANGYYSTFTYFSSKVLFDILPLRLVPPLMFGGIVYGLVGLVPTVQGFWKFMLTLVLFNLTTASVVLLLSIAFESVSVASLVGTLVMLFNLLFTGLLINRETVAPMLQWLHTISFFHAAFEALAVNELRYLQLKEIKYGVELDVPAATILSVFGLRAQSFWWPNISLLAIFFVTFTTASFLVLHFYVKEKR
ncbi:ATP-dependent permease [Coprinopsis cinerea okayama7|uniref:ATP-dependent permease n=1 Tax=Coprinopsis cinerea (strain Okayama-7 / 130 / ATCC MYA-4618 / FGSC 9003) TaxID=240176 RepID=A8P3B7_COPC7|nr:ATP-dependent permease [Coprinopsis cinerea okayama7\|eukprot:XP_001838515.2 ATP-dependent permease [Coprinopsis cinerea okayama7\